MTLKYSEGTVFLVPLRTGGYARGVVARASSKGKVLLGYFFGPRLVSSDAGELGDLDPAKAILRVRFGDLGLINGEWTIRSRIVRWNRSEWPMPDFLREDPFGMKKTVRVHYSDLDPSRVEAEYPAGNDAGLGTDSM